MANNVAMHAYGSEITICEYLTQTGEDLVTTYASLAGDAATIYASLIDVGEVLQVIESNGDGINVNQAETTHLKSPGRWREFVPGFKDAQTATIQINYTEASYKTLLNVVPQGNITPPAWGRYIWVFEYPDEGWDAQVGFIQNLGKPRLADDRIVVDVTVKFSGPIYFFTTDD